MKFHPASAQVLGINSRSYLVFIFAAVGFVASGPANAQQPIGTDVCSLVAHPNQFNKQHVQVRAQMIRGMHGSALVDDHCKREGVDFWIAKDAETHPDFKALDDIVVHHGNLGTSDKTIVGTFTGTFLKNQKIAGTHKKAMVLRADRVENLDVHFGKP